MFKIIKKDVDNLPIINQEIIDTIMERYKNELSNQNTIQYSILNFIATLDTTEDFIASEAIYQIILNLYYGYITLEDIYYFIVLLNDSTITKDTFLEYYFSMLDTENLNNFKDKIILENLKSNKIKIKKSKLGISEKNTQLSNIKNSISKISSKNTSTILEGISELSELEISLREESSLLFPNILSIINSYTDTYPAKREYTSNLLGSKAYMLNPKIDYFSNSSFRNYYDAEEYYRQILTNTSFKETYSTGVITNMHHLLFKKASYNKEFSSNRENVSNNLIYNPLRRSGIFISNNNESLLTEAMEFKTFNQDEFGLKILTEKDFDISLKRLIKKIREYIDEYNASTNSKIAEAEVEIENLRSEINLILSNRSWFEKLLNGLNINLSWTKTTESLKVIYEKIDEIESSLSYLENKKISYANLNLDFGFSDILINEISNIEILSYDDLVYFRFITLIMEKFNNHSTSFNNLLSDELNWSTIVSSRNIILSNLYSDFDKLRNNVITLRNNLLNSGKFEEVKL